MSAQAKNILVVEDDDILRETLSEFLEEEGFKVKSACDGEDALNQLTQPDSAPDLIITGLLMPRLNGWELWARLNSEKRWKNIPVVVLSTAIHSRAWPDEAVPTRLMRKPRDIGKLLHLIDSLLSETVQPNRHKKSTLNAPKLA